MRKTKKEEVKMDLFQMDRIFCRVYDHKVRGRSDYCKNRKILFLLITSMILQDFSLMILETGNSYKVITSGKKIFHDGSSWYMIPGAEGSVLCFSMVCAFAPFVAKSCCRSFKYCCAQYQSWLAPLLDPHDLVKEHRFVANSMNIIPRLPITSTGRQSRQSSSHQVNGHQVNGTAASSSSNSSLPTLLNGTSSSSKSSNLNYM